MNNENLLTKYLQAINDKKPLVINYGKGIITDKDIKDYATWNDELNCYTDMTGQWDTKLLIEIAKGNVEDIKIELGE